MIWIETHEGDKFPFDSVEQAHRFLERLLNEISEENKHGEVDFGLEVGKEKCVDSGEGK